MWKTCLNIFMTSHQSAGLRNKFLSPMTDLLIPCIKREAYVRCNCMTRSDKLRLHKVLIIEISTGWLSHWNFVALQMVSAVVNKETN